MNQLFITSEGKIVEKAPAPNNTYTYKEIRQSLGAPNVLQHHRHIRLGINGKPVAVLDLCDGIDVFLSADNFSDPRESGEAVAGESVGRSLFVGDAERVRFSIGIHGSGSGNSSTNSLYSPTSISAPADMQRAVSIERKAVKPLEVNVFLPAGMEFPDSRFDKGSRIIHLDEQAGYACLAYHENHRVRISCDTELRKESGTSIGSRNPESATAGES
jgi:hypothetical protein